MQGSSTPFERMRDRFDRLGGTGRSSSIPMDVTESDGEFVVTADVPGCEGDEVDVRVLDDRTLQVAVDFHHAEDVTGEGYLHRERRHRHVNRTVELPASVDEDGVTARCRDGVLTVTLPRSTAGRTERHVEIPG